MVNRNMWKLLAPVALIFSAALGPDAYGAYPGKGKGDGSPPQAEPGKTEDPAKEAPKPLAIVGKVVYGDASATENIAVVSVKEIFDHLPSYKKIQEENVKKTKARYHFLITQANEEFQAALEAVARTGSIVAVVEKGGVENADDWVVDLTAKVIAQITE